MELSKLGFLTLRDDFVAILRDLFATGFTPSSLTVISGDCLLSDGLECFFRLVLLSTPSSTSLSVSFGFRHRFLDVTRGASPLKFEFL